MGEQNTGIVSPNEMHVAPEKVVQKKKSNLYGVIILLFVVLIGGAGFFFLQQLRTEQEGLGGALDQRDRRIENLNDQLTALQNQINTVQQQLATVQNEISNRESKFERELSSFKDYQKSELSSVKSKLEDSITKVQSVLNRTRGDWMIADAEYLLSVANQRLTLVGDAETSLVAMRAADERLRDSGNPGVFKVREQIAREISALRTLDPVDIEGVFAKLRVLEEQIPNLPIFLPHSGAVQKPLETTPDAADSNQSSGIDTLFDTVIADLKDQVKVRRSDRELDVVLDPEEVRLIREVLKIKLEAARLALLERDSNSFREILNEIQSWIGAHFRNDDKRTQSFVSEIKSLDSVGLNIDYPNISQSLKMLENIAALRVEQDQSKAVSTKPRTQSDSKKESKSAPKKPKKKTPEKEGAAP